MPRKMEPSTAKIKPKGGNTASKVSLISPQVTGGKSVGNSQDLGFRNALEMT